MKRIFLVLFIALTSITHASAQEHEHLAIFHTDSTWKKELFTFPLNFARDIAYEGSEDARFTTGWSNPESSEHWAYVFGWNIKHAEEITLNQLEQDLTFYFNGLMRVNTTSISLTKETGSEEITNYSGTVKTKDAFFSKEAFTLNVKIEQRHCQAQGKSIIRFRFSPKPFTHSVWEKLEEPTVDQALIECGETKAYKIHDLLEKCYEYGRFNGTALVADESGVIYKGGFGYANLEWKRRNHADTKHRLASITKQFTAMLIAQLAAEGKLEFNAPITTYLKDYPKEIGDQVTVHHLLTHTSGIPSYTSMPSYWESTMNAEKTTEDLMNLFKNEPLEFQPGEKYNYNYSGYILLGVIVEKLTGKSYAKNMQERVFEPLGMKNSGYDSNSTLIENKASGYDRVANSFQHARYLHMSVPYAAGALYSTVEDLYLWDRALYTNKILPKEYRDLLFEAHTPSWGGQHYGYGWELGSMRIGSSDERAPTISHGGGINGFNTLITRVVEDQTVVLLLNNTGGAPLGDMTSAVLGILKGKDYILPQKSLAYYMLDTLEAKGIAAGLEFFETNKAGNGYYLNEREVNLSGYKLLQDENVEAAAAVFKLNTETYPNSFNAYDSYGEALLLLGKKEEGIENYKKSVKLNPDNENGIKVLQDLGVDTESLIVKLPVEYLRKLEGNYEAKDREGWIIKIEESDGALYGNDNGYRYRLTPVGEGKFINSDDGATIDFDTSDKDNVSFVIFGRVTFQKVK